MLALRVKIVDRFERLRNAASQAAFRNFGHAAASIRRDAQESIERSDDPSAPGAPPHTRRGLLRRAIRYAASDRGAVIGPVASLVGESAAAHEFGEEFHDTTFPERPFMAPARARAIPRIGGEWRGSIGE